MSGRISSEAGVHDAPHESAHPAPHPAPSDAPGTDAPEDAHEDAYVHEDEGAYEDGPSDARRARWTATGAGALLTTAGLAAAVLRALDSVPPLVPLAYACGASGCALAAVLGSRGRTRRALWLMIAGTALMAVGDQFD
ncbi:hypothetical protein [Streptomyces griseoaurantiacus]|uniref:hypothetical protein n=1 Tax=Streptomyces griseoaurantiacus TaxID=68213 RepID=UPI0019CECAD3|nr:hypothetical protein GCM10018782_58900 [Streptomyces griseoaurantiacus]